MHTMQVFHKTSQVIVVVSKMCLPAPRSHAMQEDCNITNKGDELLGPRMPGGRGRGGGGGGVGADLGYLHPIVQVLEGHGHRLERQHHALSLQLLPIQKALYPCWEGHAAYHF